MSDTIPGWDKVEPALRVQLGVTDPKTFGDLAKSLAGCLQHLNLLPIVQEHTVVVVGDKRTVFIFSDGVDAFFVSAPTSDVSNIRSALPAKKLKMAKQILESIRYV